jgi:hypothetical protein
MAEWLPPGLRSTPELRAQAVAYRGMAATARTTDVATALLRLADRFDALADQRRERAHAAPVRLAPGGVTG